MIKSGDKTLNWYVQGWCSVLCENPKLLVTCRTGSEELCIHEVCNVLFHKDPEVRAEKSRYPGLVFIYTNLDVDRAYRVVSFREYGFVENIIPVHCVLEYPVDPTRAGACISRLVKSSPVKLKIRSRGVRGVSGELFSLLAQLLLEAESRHDPTSKTCLFVEVVESRVYVGLGSCHSVFKASIMNGWVKVSV